MGGFRIEILLVEIQDKISVGSVEPVVSFLNEDRNITGLPDDMGIFARGVPECKRKIEIMRKRAKKVAFLAQFCGILREKTKKNDKKRPKKGQKRAKNEKKALQHSTLCSIITALTGRKGQQQNKKKNNKKQKRKGSRQ